ncbi:unnamed protein product [marine sediment metagenome]|uniref:Uncharacterized protein n=1 Tax=marine sediment metagenome TaxID=412755 RepID=X1G425_9ZZZZ
MKQWKKQHLAGVVGVLIGVSLAWKLGFSPALFVVMIGLVVVALVAKLYDIDRYYLEKGPYAFSYKKENKK